MPGGELTTTYIISDNAISTTKMNQLPLTWQKRENLAGQTGGKTNYFKRSGKT